MTAIETNRVRSLVFNSLSFLLGTGIRRFSIRIVPETNSLEPELADSSRMVVRDGDPKEKPLEGEVVK